MSTNNVPSKPMIGSEINRNPNKHVSLNSAPEGPYAPDLGVSGAGGLHGDDMAKGKNGQTFHFK